MNVTMLIILEDSIFLISANWYSEYTQIRHPKLAQLCCVYKVKMQFTPRNHL